MKAVVFLIRLAARVLLQSEWERVETALKANYAKQQSSRIVLSPLLQMLLISGEDHRFFSHGGFDVVAIFRALWKNTVFGKREGASTIEQQVVRVLSGNYDKTVRRKVKEILLSTLVDSIVPKRDLPTLYLNIAYYGWKMNSLHDASVRLGIDVERPTLWEAASLVARLKYPQPFTVPINRVIQIERRSRHLMTLYSKHCQQNVYVGLGDHATIYRKGRSKQAQAGLSEAI